MRHNWRSVLTRLSLSALLLALLGYALGNPWLALLLGLTVYLLYTLHQLLRLSRWLQESDAKAAAPPEARGIWGNIFDSIYRIQRRELQSSGHLKSIISKAQESTAAIDIAVVMIDPRGNLEWWNDAAEKLLGFQSPQDHRQAVTNLIREPAFVDYYQKRKFRTPLQLNSPTNPRMILEYQITSFGEGERLMLVRDITQLHKLESMRKDFIGNVSHELRTPITVITGYLETLLDQEDRIPEQWDKPLRQMYQQSRRMEDIIRDLLTLTRLETGSVSREQATVPIPELLQEVIEAATQVHASKSHQFNLHSDGLVLLRGEYSELYSAFANLVLNAAKYTPAHGVIDVSCHAGPQGMFVEVKDNGPGIAAEHIPRLTERFYRVDESRSSDTGGTGLGLAIVKHVLARHGGTLTINSVPGEGSRFICRFPTDRVSSAPAG